MNKNVNASCLGWGGFACVALLLSGCSEPEIKKELIRPIRTMVVADLDAMNANYLPGQAEAWQEANLGFEVPGTVKLFPSKKGDSVKSGTMLAQLDQRDFKNDLEAAQAELDRTKVLYERTKKAAESGAVARQDLDNAKANMDIARADQQVAEKALNDTSIYAPFDGMIIDRFVENFERVQAKQNIVRILDVTKVKMTVDVPESYISNIKYVTEMWCEFDPFPEVKVPAAILEVSNEASETTRTYPVTIVMNQPDKVTILPGMTGKLYARAKLPGADEMGGYEVSSTAVFETADGESAVWVCEKDSMTVKQRKVEVKRTTARGIIVAGVEPGEVIATAGVHFLEEGQKVKLSQ